MSPWAKLHPPVDGCRPVEVVAVYDGIATDQESNHRGGLAWLTQPVPALDPVALLAAHDAQLRGHLPDPMPVGGRVEWDGPVLRHYTEHGGFIGYRSVADLASDELDELIARQRDIFAARGEQVEWKWHSHDLPSDLPDRLQAAGFAPEDRETVVVGLAEPLTGEPVVLPDGVHLRQVTERVDLDRIAATEGEVWSEERSWLAEGPAAELAADPTSLTIPVAEAGDDVVSAGWVRYAKGTDFASLWRLHPTALAPARNLSRTRCRSGPPGNRVWVPVPAGRCVRRQPADPGTSGLRPAHGHGALRVQPHGDDSGLISAAQ